MGPTQHAQVRVTELGGSHAVFHCPYGFPAGVGKGRAKPQPAQLYYFKFHRPFHYPNPGRRSSIYYIRCYGMYGNLVYTPTSLYIFDDDDTPTPTPYDTLPAYPYALPHTPMPYDTPVSIRLKLYQYGSIPFPCHFSDLALPVTTYQTLAGLGSRGFAPSPRAGGGGGGPKKYTWAMAF